LTGTFFLSVPPSVLFTGSCIENLVQVCQFIWRYVLVAACCSGSFAVPVSAARPLGESARALEQPNRSGKAIHLSDSCREGS